MSAKTFPQTCIDIIYPAYEAIYEVKQNDTNKVVINKTFLVIADIQAQRTHLDIFALELLDTCRASYGALTLSDKPKRKELDKIVNDIMYKLADLLRGHNKSKDFGWIDNLTGKFADHYTSKKLSFTK
jgi:hypothetical protein